MSQAVPLSSEPHIGPYRLLHERGSGAYARAYLAEHPADGRLVVVKVAHTWNPLVEAAFRQEFLLGSRLRHPHLGEVMDHGVSAAGRPYLVLVFDDGEPLSEQPGPWSEPEIGRVGLALARGLVALHAQGLVHRDLTPANVLVGAQSARLIDFGMLTPAGAAGGAAGTPSYLAPEAFDGAGVDGRADLYALGALLYRQACGQAPFESLEGEALVRAVLEQPVPPIARLAPQLSPGFAALVTRLLAKNPDDRPASALEVAAQLVALLPGEVVSALPLAEAPWQPGAAWQAWEPLALEPGVFALVGPPGVGLTRAMQEAYREVRRQDRQALLLSGLELTGPYALVSAIARWATALAPAGLAVLDSDVRSALAPLWGWVALDGEAVAAPDAMRVAAALPQALAALLQPLAAEGRLAIMIDDWDAADAASRAVLTAAWQGELAFCHWLLASRAPVPGARAFALEPMSEPQLGAWVAACLHGNAPAGLASQLHHASGGNPGWAYQALLALHQTGRLGRHEGTGPLDLVPGSVEATLALQFQTLTPDQRGLAELLAVYGAAFTLDDLVPLGGVLAASWPLELPRLVARGLLVQHGGTYRWATGWWAAWVRGQAGAARRGRLALTLARALEAHWLAPGKLRSAGLLHRLAELYEQTDDDSARIRLGLEAGLACAGLYANDAARAHYASGLAAVERGADPQGELALKLRIARADLARLTGELEGAAAAYLACLEAIDDPVLRARLFVSLAKARQMNNQPELALGALEQALELLDSAPDDPATARERARALATLARLLQRGGRREEALARAREALALARTLGEREHQADAAAFLGQQLAGVAATAAEGLALLEEALALQTQLHSQLGRNDVHMLLGNASYAQGRFVLARQHFEANRAIARKIGNRSEAAFAAINLALCASELGGFAEMRTAALEALALAGAMQDAYLIGFARFLEAHAAMHLGELVQGEAALAIAREHERALDLPDLRVYGLVFEAERHLFMGRFSQAAHAGELARALVAKGIGSELAARAHLVVAEAWLHDLQLARAEVALAAATREVERTGALAPRGWVKRLEGFLAWRQGEVEQARGHWLEGLALAREQGLQALELKLLLGLHLLERLDLSRRPEGEALETAYAIAGASRTPDPLALACLGLAIQHLEGGRDLLAERVSRRGHDLLALYLDALPGQTERLAFQSHPERAPFCEAREVETAYRLQQRGRRLEMLLQLAEQLASSREPAGVLALVRHFTLEITAAERCLVLLQHAPGKLLLHGEVQDGSYSQTIVGRVVATRRAECVLDTHADQGLVGAASILDLRVRAVMCVPLVIEQVLHGVLYVDSRVALGAFTAEDLRVVEAIARQAAVSLDNARMHAIQQQLIRQKDEQLKRIDMQLAELRETRGELVATAGLLRHREHLDRLRERYFEAESHDLRAPLGSIRAAAQGLLKGVLGQLNPEQAEALTGIELNQRSLITRINGILDGAKLEADKLAITPRPVALARPIAAACALVAAQAAEKGLVLRWDEAAFKGLWALADERRLESVLLNLLGNAVKFTQVGEVAVETRPAPPGRVAFVVRDTGPGIPAARCQNLFERYGASTDTELALGSGLGLWLVKGTVDAHNGSLLVETAPGTGTAFVVELPAAP